MERESTKHGPLQDEELKHETQAMERSVSAQRPHVEEWREVEPAGDIPAARRQGAEPDAEAEAITLRSELARVLTSDDFPAGRDGLLARLEDADVPGALTAAVARLDPGRRFASAHEVMVALGINAPEHSPHQTGPHQTGPHQTGPHQTGPHQTGPHQTGPHQTGPHQTGPR
jgi:hypothetical protein